MERQWRIIETIQNPDPTRLFMRKCIIDRNEFYNEFNKKTRLIPTSKQILCLTTMNRRSE